LGHPVQRRDCLEAPAIGSGQGRRALGDFAGGYGDPLNAYTKELLTAIPHPPLPVT
jgi:hypothetical protein